MKPITQEVITTHTYPYIYRYYGEPYIWNVTYLSNDTHIRGGGTSCSTFTSKSIEDAPIAMASCNYSAPEPTSDIGITVKGNECRQDFGSTYISDLEEQSHVLVLKLSGYQDKNKKVSKIISSRDRIYCPKCGKSNAYGSKYCTNCGKLIVGL